MRSRRISFAGLGILALVTLLWAHEGHKAITTKGVMLGPVSGNLLLEPLAQKAVGLATTQVQFGTVEDTLRVPARVVLPWDRQAFASTRIGGIVASIRVKPGDFVKEGDVLAEIVSLEVEALRLELEQRELEHALVTENLRRARELGERIIAGKELLELEAEQKDKANEASVVRAKLGMLGIPPGKEPGPEVGNGHSSTAVPITAPLSGAVVHIDTTLGASVEPLQHLFKIHSLSRVWVEGEVPESRASEVKAGLAVRLAFAAYPGREFKATLERVGTEVPEKARTVGVWASLENADLLIKPGLSGEMRIVLGAAENVAVAPVRAIVEDGAERYALVEEKASTYVRVDPKEKIEEYSPEKKEGYTPVGAFVKKGVVVGRSDGKFVEVVEGLYPGDRIVQEASHELAALYVQGALKLSDEAKKNIRLATEEVDLRGVGEVVRLNALLRLPVGKGALASSRIEGKVKKILVAPGDGVRAGQVLAEVDSFELQNLQFEFYRASLRERLRGLLAQRLGSLGEITPRRELLKAETEYRAQKAAAQNLRRRLELLGARAEALDKIASSGEMLPSIPITSPIDGRVNESSVVLGQVVKPGDPLFHVSDNSVLWAEAQVYERDFKAVLAGELKKEVVLRAGGREVRAALSFSSQSVGYQEKVLPVFAEVKNEEGALLPGMLAEALVKAGPPGKPVIAAPNRAILSVGGQSFAFVAEGNTFKRVALELGRRDADYTEVRKGLFPGDKVAVSGVNSLNTAINTLK